jgi:hypothetical protein
MRFNLKKLFSTAYLHNSRIYFSYKSTSFAARNRRRLTLPILLFLIE